MFSHVNVSGNWNLYFGSDFQVDLPRKRFLLLSLFVEEGRHGHVDVELEAVGLRHQEVDHRLAGALNARLFFAEMKRKPF